MYIYAADKILAKDLHQRLNVYEMLIIWEVSLGIVVLGIFRNPIC